MLIIDRFLGLQQDIYFTDNCTAALIIAKLANFTLFLKNYFNITIKVIKLDNKIITIKPQVQRQLKTKGIIIKPSALDIQAQNSRAKRLGGVNKEKARAIRLDANLSQELWPEVTRAAVYLYNRTLNYSNNQKTPYKIFFTHTAFSNSRITLLCKLNLSYLKAYRCKAFAMSNNTH